MALGLSLLPLARAFVGAPGAGLQAALASRRSDVRVRVRGGVRTGRVGVLCAIPRVLCSSTRGEGRAHGWRRFCPSTPMYPHRVLFHVGKVEASRAHAKIFSMKGCHC